jgi:GPH family glycoside/pentoside/hexuronide:cation symporter
MTTLSILAGVNGLFGGAVAVMFWSMLPDMVEYGQWYSRVRDEGIVFGLNQLISKSSSGVGLLGILLGAIGYSANEVQSQNTLEGIRTLSFLVPLASSLLGAAIIWFYPLDAALHGRIVEALKWRGA